MYSRAALQELREAAARPPAWDGWDAPLTDDGDGLLFWTGEAWVTPEHWDRTCRLLRDEGDPATAISPRRKPRRQLASGE